jgi:sensor histidine kinase regulating citrate/malate metabolism
MAIGIILIGIGVAQLFLTTAARLSIDSMAVSLVILLAYLMVGSRVLTRELRRRETCKARGDKV